MLKSRISRFMSGLVLFATGYTLYVLTPVGAQFILSADATETLNSLNMRWIQAAYLILVAVGYSVLLVIGAYRMTVPTLSNLGMRLLLPSRQTNTPDRAQAPLPGAR